jgi:type IV pilus assembly protein PilC
MPIFGPADSQVIDRQVHAYVRHADPFGREHFVRARKSSRRPLANSVIEAAVMRTRTSIQQGDSITKPLIESGVFPPMVTRMIEVGERTGALETMLTKIADFYEDQVNAMVAGLTSLIEPLLIVFLGVVVGFIVISMFMPMFKMIELVSKKPGKK